MNQKITVKCTKKFGNPKTTSIPIPVQNQQQQQNYIQQLLQYLEQEIVRTSQRGECLQTSALMQTDEYYEKLVQKQRSLYAQLHSQHKYRLKVEQQLEQQQQHLQQMERILLQLNAKIETSNHSIMALTNQKLQMQSLQLDPAQSRASQIDQQMEKYGDNKKKHKYLQHKMANINIILAKQESALRQLIMLRQNQSARPNQSSSKKHKAESSGDRNGMQVKQNKTMWTVENTINARVDNNSKDNRNCTVFGGRSSLVLDQELTSIKQFSI